MSAILPKTFGQAPNVQGWVSGILNAASGTQYGALTMDRLADHVGQELGNETGYTALSIDASLSNSIYGSSNKVQPKVFNTLMIIKN